MDVSKKERECLEMLGKKAPWAQIKSRLNMSEKLIVKVSRGVHLGKAGCPRSLALSTLRLSKKKEFGPVITGMFRIYQRVPRWKDEKTREEQKDRITQETQRMIEEISGQCGIATSGLALIILRLHSYFLLSGN